MEVTVIDFDNKGFTNQVIGRIASLGIESKLIQKNDWHISHCGKKYINILALDTPSTKNINHIKKVILNTRPLLLGAFSSKYKFSNASLAELLTDCFTCPCSNGELSYRLDRVGINSGENTKNKTHNRPLLAEMVGTSKKYEEMCEVLRKMSMIDAPVLIEGESGTGKELAARALHYNSSRKDSPFIPVNCGAMPKDLIENELFGHKKGAYTGASDTCKGLISLAENGTLFLDEIANIDIRSQGVLLRFLQNHEYSRLGSGNVRKANVRLICATNETLTDKVEDKSFRLDLFYRINVLNIELPPLREREEDIIFLANHFLSMFQKKYAGATREFSFEYLEGLKQYNWPGNIRELENMIHRDYLMSDDHFIHANSQHLSSNEYQDKRSIEKFRDAKAQVIMQFELNYLKELMEKTKGNITKAAQLAGKDRRDFSKLLKKYNIERKYFL